MTATENKTLTITLHGDDADKFKKIVQRITEESQRAGFSNSLLDADQKEFIKNLNEKIPK